MTISVGRYLKKKDYISVSKGVQKEKLQLAKVFVTCKNFILLSKKNTYKYILGFQNSVPRDPNSPNRDPNSVFWLAQK